MTFHERDLVFDAKDIAQILKCSLQTAYRVFDQKDFPGIKLGSSKRALRRVSREAFFRWLNSKQGG